MTGLWPSGENKLVFPSHCGRDRPAVLEHPSVFVSYAVKGFLDDIWHVLFSPNLASWTEDGVLVSSTPNGDGTATELWRSAAPVAADAKSFARVRVDGP